MLCCAALLIALSVGAAADEPAEVVLPRRTTLAVQLGTNVKTNHAHVGDPVAATLVSAVLLHGVVAVPKAARLMGHVLVVQAHADGVPSRLIVRFEEAQWTGHSVKLNAFIVHQIIEKRVVLSAVEGGCAPPERDTTGVVVPRRSGPSLTPWTGCPEGSVGETAEQKMEFTTPAMKDVTVRRSTDPPHTIELVSAKKNIDLHRGMLLELRHIARPAQ
jgi:hypothetical protein